MADKKKIMTPPKGPSNQEELEKQNFRLTEKADEWRRRHDAVVGERDAARKRVTQLEAENAKLTERVSKLERQLGHSRLVRPK